MISNKELIKKAKDVAKFKKVSQDIRFGDVGCALITDKGNIYTGVSIHLYCGVGFCAEHSAIANMITNREYVIKKTVAVSSEGKIFPACGRCRELMYQINKKNKDTEVIIGKNKTAKLKKLLPHYWKK